MNRNSKVVLATALLMFAAAGSTWLFLNVSDGRETRLNEQAAPTQAAPLALNWREGTSQRYRFLVDSSIELFVPGTESQPLSQKVDGVLHFETLDVDLGGALVGLRLDPVALEVGGSPDPDAGIALGTPFRVRFGYDGMPAAFEYPAGLDERYRGLLEELVRCFQVTLRDQENWTVEEQHGSGAYVADYTNAGRSRVHKTKSSYAEGTGVQVLASEASLRVASDRDWIASMTVDETLRMNQPSGVRAEVATHAELELLPESAASLASNGAAVPLDPWSFEAAGPRSSAASRQVPEAPRRSREELERELFENLAALEEAGADRLDWIHELRDLLIEDEALALRLLEVMKESELDDRTQADLFLVFELAGTGTAQEALCQVVADPSWAQRDGVRALIALGGVAQPTEESLEALWATSEARSTPEAEELASTALLALGGIGNTLHADGVAEYPALRSALTGAAFSARDSRERAVCMLALGNTGDPTLRDEVVPFLDDGEARVRRAAAQALAKLGAESIGDELAARLASEPNGSVRATLAGALSEWGEPSPASMETIRGCVGGEIDEVARLEMARLLGRNLEAHPENLETLRTLFETEGSNRVRRYLGETFAKAGR